MLFPNIHFSGINCGPQQHRNKVIQFNTHCISHRSTRTHIEMSLMIYAKPASQPASRCVCVSVCAILYCLYIVNMLYSNERNAITTEESHTQFQTFVFVDINLVGGFVSIVVYFYALLSVCVCVSLSVFPCLRLFVYACTSHTILLLLIEPPMVHVWVNTHFKDAHLVILIIIRVPSKKNRQTHTDHKIREKITNLLFFPQIHFCCEAA